MASVEIDDAIYIEVQRYLGSLHWDRELLGAGAAFERFMRHKDPVISDERMLALEGMLRELFDYNEGRYFAGTGWHQDKTIVWSFHRAWVDRFGWVFGVPERAETPAG